MGSEGNTDEVGSDIPRPLIDPATLQAHSRDRAMNRFMQWGIDSVGTKCNATQRPPRERGLGQQMSNRSHVYDRAADQQEQRGPGEPADMANHNLLGFLFICNHVCFPETAGLSLFLGQISTNPLTKVNGSEIRKLFRPKSVQNVTFNTNCHILLTKAGQDVNESVFAKRRQGVSFCGRLKK